MPIQHTCDQSNQSTPYKNCKARYNPIAYYLIERIPKIAIEIQILFIVSKRLSQFKCSKQIVSDCHSMQISPDYTGVKLKFVKSTKEIWIIKNNQWFQRAASENDEFVCVKPR